MAELVHNAWNAPAHVGRRAAGGIIARDNLQHRSRHARLGENATAHVIARARRCLPSKVFICFSSPVGRVTRPRQFRLHHRCAKTRRVGNNFIPLQRADPGKAASRLSEPVTHSDSRSWPSQSTLCPTARRDQAKAFKLQMLFKNARSESERGEEPCAESTNL